MKVDIVELDQNIVLATGEMQNFIILSLPSGKELRALVTADDLQMILDANGTQATSDYEEYEEGALTSTVEEAVEEAAEVDWAELPEDICPSAIKEMLTKAGLPRLLQREAFIELIKGIELDLLAGEQPEVEETSVVTQTATTTIKEVPRRHTGGVGTDAAGNPVVQKVSVPSVFSVDPGEVIDEDGVVQL